MHRHRYLSCSLHPFFRVIQFDMEEKWSATGWCRSVTTTLYGWNHYCSTQSMGNALQRQGSPSDTNTKQSSTTTIQDCLLVRPSTIIIDCHSCVAWLDIGVNSIITTIFNDLNWLICEQGDAYGTTSPSSKLRKPGRWSFRESRQSSFYGCDNNKTIELKVTTNKHIQRGEYSLFFPFQIEWNIQTSERVNLLGAQEDNCRKGKCFELGEDEHIWRGLDYGMN